MSSHGKLPEIIQQGSKALHIKAQKIPIDEITSSEIQTIISQMKSALAGEPDGVAIAAPQINISKCIFVVAGFVFGEDKPDVTYINPQIVKTSKKTKELEEGCLSVRYMYGVVKRHTNVTLEAYNEQGQKIERGAGGLLAHIFQHETDHLDGILFTDRSDTTEMMSEKEIKHLNNKRDEAKQHITK